MKDDILSAVFVLQVSTLKEVEICPDDPLLEVTPILFAKEKVAGSNPVLRSQHRSTLTGVLFFPD